MSFNECQSVEVVGTGSEHDGKIWTVVGRAPNKRFTLPNGVRHEKPTCNDAWIVKMSDYIKVPGKLAGLYTEQFVNNYGVCDAKYLRAVE